MENQTFTDGIGRITVIGGIVRLDLVTYSPNETDASGQPRAIFTQRIVMGADAFLRSSEKILETARAITRQQAQPQQQQAQQPVQHARAPEPAAQPAAQEPPAPQPPRKPFP